MMGGTGNLDKLFSDYPNFVKPPHFDVYYIFITGYHIESLYYHSRADLNTDYFEMIFHHILTLTLIFFSYLSCFTKVGMVILWLHLWADIFSSAARAWGNINDYLAVFNFVFLVFTWGYS